MNALIPIDNNAQGQPTVNARDLHDFLEVGKMFTHWIKARIEKYGFIEGQDYILTNAKTGKRQNVVVHDYHLTLDMAKELAMVENNAKGREARRYFIEVEKQAKATPRIPTTAEALYALADKTKENEALQAQLQEQAPVVAAMERLEASEGSVSLTIAAKELGIPPRRLNTWLLVNGWLYRRAGSNTLTAYQGKITSGYLEHKSYTYTASDGFDKTRDQVLVTAKGRAKLAKMLNDPSPDLPMAA
mgnify:CR=1 FL=1